MLIWKLHKIPILIAFISAFFYALIAYDLVRTDYTKLILLYGALCFLFYKLINATENFKFLLVLGFVFRLIFLFATPNLSQDFYRFIWDGRLLIEGFNPYLYTVESFMSQNQFPVADAQELYNGMGALNASHFTNYPPLSQLCFAIAGLFAGKSIIGSVLVMRILIIVADFGTLYFGKKLLEKLNMPIQNIFWYILNPFIIIELTGNLHFEGVMIFFLVWSLYLLHIGKWKIAAVIFACSVSVKLIPLLFLPVLFQKLRCKKSILFYLIVGLTSIALFAPFYSENFITNYTKTVALWFQDFEFNASIYYIFREIGYWITSYNEIATIGKILPLVVIIFVLGITFFRTNKNTTQLITALLFVLSFYYFTATTVHPWYVATLLILSIFTNYKFPLVWSFVIVLSYLAYTNTDNSENLWVIALEYLIVFSVFIWEVFIKKKPPIMVA